MHTHLLAGVLLSLVPTADPAALPAGRVTLTGAEKTLAAAAASLARQANIPIDVERAAKDRTVQLRLADAPFWSALERLAHAANHRLEVGGQGARIALINEPYQPVPTHVDGPFRFSARGTVSKLAFDTNQGGTEITIDVAWEPRFKAFHAEVPAKAWAAFEADGKPLATAADGSGKMEVTGTGLELTARLSGVPRTVPKVGRLDGVLVLVGTGQLLQFMFAVESPGDGIAQRQAEVAATLKTFRKAGPFWTATVDFAYPPGGPEFETFQSYLRDNEVWLLRADGTKFPAAGFELGVERGGRTTVTYRFKENEKDGPVLSNLKDWKLVVRTPGRISEVRVPFTLRDIRLP
jgi:hypothetical protein